MKNIGIYVNKNKDKTLEITKKITTAFESAGFNCSVLIDYKRTDDPEIIEKTRQFVKKCEALIVLGGDGTILRIASVCAKYSVPVLSINLGHLGFLTELELDELEQGVQQLARDDFFIDERMMLSCQVNGNEILALNDVCIQRLSRARLLKFNAYASGELVDSLSADGVLVSSPTGSTAYSLSAGGPIVSPRVSLLLMTPVCAHTLRARPFVFKDDETLMFTTSDNCGFAVICDGVQIQQFNGSSLVEVSRSSCSLKLINFKQRNFFKRLNSKLNEWNFNKED